MYNVCIIDLNLLLGIVVAMKSESPAPECISQHYENLPMQYTEIFLALKIENFQLKNFVIFLIFAQNIDCGYTLPASTRRFYGVPTIYVLEQK